jgi:hypothetical protein
MKDNQVVTILSAAKNKPAELRQRNSDGREKIRMAGSSLSSQDAPILGFLVRGSISPRLREDGRLPIHIPFGNR